MDALEEIAFRRASVGDILPLDEGDEPPAGWLRMDDERRLTVAWPEFAEAMHLRTDHFILPEAPAVEGRYYAIKMASEPG